MAIYLHETVDCISGKMDEYFQGLYDEAVPFLIDWKMHLVGMYQVNYSSGAWPEAVAIWEIADWETYAWQMKTAPLNKGNNRYMNLAVKWRTGGFDRLLLPLPWSPRPPIKLTMDKPTFQSTEAVFFHHTYQVRPGAARTFLDAMKSEVVPKAAEIGLTLEAFWRTAFRPLEYIAMWSVPDWDAYARFQNRRDPEDEGSQLPGLGPVWASLTDLTEKVLLASTYSPLGGGGKDITSTL